MAWSERTQVDERMRFVAAMESCQYTMSELCRAFGISRKTGYKWAGRYVEEGVVGLLDRSRAPHHCGRRLDETVVAELVAFRRLHPTWGPRKILKALAKQKPDWDWPAPSTVGELLSREGLVQARRRRQRRSLAAMPAVKADRPNATWTGDFKGEFRLGDGSLCYPLTLRDASSRRLLACDARSSTATKGAREVFEKAFTSFGLPEEILTDGGVPFAGAASVCRLSRLSVWWIKLGIKPIITQPSHPEQNGAHEQMHRVLKAETTRPPAPNLHGQQHVFDRFLAEYNEVRPHEGIGMRTPAELYLPSERPYRGAPAEMTYPSHYEVRRVRGNGEFRLKSRWVFLSEVLSGELVGLEETNHQRWSLHFGPLLLGRYDQRDHLLHRL